MMKYFLGFAGMGCFAWVGGAILGIAFWTGLVWAIIHILKSTGVL